MWPADVLLRTLVPASCLRSVTRRIPRPSAFATGTERRRTAAGAAAFRDSNSSIFASAGSRYVFGHISYSAPNIRLMADRLRHRWSLRPRNHDPGKWLHFWYGSSFASRFGLRWHVHIKFQLPPLLSLPKPARRSACAMQLMFLSCRNNKRDVLRGRNGNSLSRSTSRGGTSDANSGE